MGGFVFLSVMFATLAPVFAQPSGPVITSTPEQIFLSLSSAPSSSSSSPLNYVVSWVTNSSKSSTLHVGSSPDSLSTLIQGDDSIAFEDLTCTSQVRQVHSVNLDVVQLSHRLFRRHHKKRQQDLAVYYQPESDNVRGPIFSFRPFNSLSSSSSSLPQPSRFVLFGDFGFETNNTVYEPMSNLVKQGEVDAIIHIGDIAYNLDHDCNRVGDYFMNRIQPVSATVPYLFGIGNHETDPNYTYYSFLQRYSPAQLSLAAGSSSPTIRYFSVNLGLVHFAIIDTDAWIYEPVFPLAQPIYKWLDQDLSAVDRAKTPWIVVLGHRLMYCTKTTDGECNGEALSLRYGVENKTDPSAALPGLEQLLIRYGVDLYLGGHTHHNEVTWPVVEGKETQTDYVNPKGTVHVQCGMAGVGDGTDPFDVPQESWEQWRDLSFTRAYTTFHALNDTHAKVELHGNKGGGVGAILNEFTIVQSQHGPFQRDYVTPGTHKISMQQLKLASASVVD